MRRVDLYRFALILRASFDEMGEKDRVHHDPSVLPRFFFL
jgi:hypothetical protein